MFDSDFVTVDQRYLECSAINTEAHLRASLGDPLELPEHIDSGAWVSDEEERLCRWFARMTHQQYRHILRDNTYNSENDLSSNFVFSVFAPEDCSDWIWANDVFIVVETHLGGDVRGNYGAFQVFRVDSVGDSGFLDWTLGWHASPINSDAVDFLAKCEDQTLQRANDELSNGWSSHPTSHLLQDVIMPNTEPTWSDRLNCWVARLKDVDFAVRLEPQEPCYG